jgi:hypothetical protein
MQVNVLVMAGKCATVFGTDGEDLVLCRKRPEGVPEEDRRPWQLGICRPWTAASDLTRFQSPDPDPTRKKALAIQRRY